MQRFLDLENTYSFTQTANGWALGVSEHSKLSWETSRRGPAVLPGFLSELDPNCDILPGAFWGEPMNAVTTIRPAEVELEYICSYWATLAPPEVIGPVPEGIRVNFYVTAGEVTGPKMRGKLRTVGGDWLLLRHDGVGVLDVRATLELDNGALIYTTYGGVVDLGPDGYKLFLQGVLPPIPELRIAPRYHTSHPDYLWLNRLQCVGVGTFDVAHSRVTYDIHALR